MDKITWPARWALWKLLVWLAPAIAEEVVEAPALLRRAFQLGALRGDPVQGLDVLSKRQLALLWAYRLLNGENHTQEYWSHILAEFI